MCLGIPGQIVAISDPENLLGIVDICGVKREVNLVCIADRSINIEQNIGKWVLVHVGFAMSCIDEAEAKLTLEVLESLGSFLEETSGPNQESEYA